MLKLLDRAPRKAVPSFLLLCVSILCVFGLAGAGPKAKQPDLSTPEKTIRSFVAALNARDLTKAAASVAGANPKAEGLSEMWQFDNQMAKATYAIEQIRVTTKGNQASAQLRVRLSAAGQSIRRDERLQLRRARGRWQIVPPAVSLSAPVSGILQNQSQLLGHPAPFFEIFRVARGNARRIVCSNQLKEIAQAALQYAQKHQGRLVFTETSFKKALSPFLKETKFRCGENQSGKDSYSFNVYLTGMTLKAVEDPAKTVLFYEGSARKLAFRHKRLRPARSVANVAFVDGHVEEIDEKQASTLKWAALTPGVTPGRIGTMLLVPPSDQW